MNRNQKRFQTIIDEVRDIIIKHNNEFYEFNTGIPQGYSASPLLSSILIYDAFIVRKLDNIDVHFYVDDILFTISEGFESPSMRKRKIESRLKEYDLTIEWNEGKFCDSKLEKWGKAKVFSVNDWCGSRRRYAGRYNPLSSGITKKQIIDLAIVRYKRIKSLTLRMSDDGEIKKMEEFYKITVAEIEAEIALKESREVETINKVYDSIPWGYGKAYTVHRWKRYKEELYNKHIELLKEKLLQSGLSPEVLDEAVDTVMSQNKLVISKAIGFVPIWAMIKLRNESEEVSDESCSEDETFPIYLVS